MGCINGHSRETEETSRANYRAGPAATRREEPGGGIDARSIVSRGVHRMLEDTGNGWWKNWGGESEKSHGWSSLHGAECRALTPALPTWPLFMASLGICTVWPMMKPEDQFDRLFENISLASLCEGYQPVAPQSSSGEMQGDCADTPLAAEVPRDVALSDARTRA